VESAHQYLSRLPKEWLSPSCFARVCKRRAFIETCRIRRRSVRRRVDRSELPKNELSVIASKREIIRDFSTPTGNLP
jgi:hypothetical protein